MVAEYLECVPGTKFDLVKLRVDVNSLPTLNNSLSTIICYNTPYYVGVRPLVLSFALGENLSLNTILGTPNLEQLQAILDIWNQTFVL